MLGVQLLIGPPRLPNHFLYCVWEVADKVAVLFGLRLLLLVLKRPPPIGSDWAEVGKECEYSAVLDSTKCALVLMAVGASNPLSEKRTLLEQNVAVRGPA